MISGRVRNLILMLADAACIAACWAVVVFGYRAVGGSYDPAIYMRLWPVVPGFVALNILFRLYHGRLLYPAAPFSPIEEMRRLIGSSFILHVGVLATLALKYQTTVGYSRLVIAVSGILVALLAQPVRDLMRRGLFRLGLGQIPVVVAGAGPVAQRLADSLSADPYSGFRLVGFFSLPDENLDGVRRLGDLHDIIPRSRERGVRTLFVCEDERLFRCQLHGLTEWFTFIEYFPTSEIFPVAGSRTIAVDGVGGVEMVNQDRMRFLRVEKWLLDKLLSAVAFLLLFPFIVAIGLVVKLTSPGPVFFRHERLGKKGRPFRLWKFRTMYRDADERLAAILAADPKAAAEWAESFKLKNDPRVTPFGRFLRRTSLDEIPQILNVIGGSMALVGPRPIVADEVRFYGKSYDIFASVLPGVTGLWQVSGRSDTSYPRRVALDTYYILNWSFWLDLWILFRTVREVLLMRGAR